MAAEVEAITALLQQFLAQRLPGARDVRISGLVRPALGLSRENWPFDATWTDGHSDGRTHTEKLIMRRDPVGSVLETDRRLEVAALRLLERTRIPVPRVRWFDPSGEIFTRPAMIMPRLPGVGESFILRDTQPPEKGLALARRLCELLAEIHLLDWQALGFGDLMSDPGRDASQRALEEWEAVLRKQQLEAFPELELALVWLRANAPDSQRTVLVHGDFKPGNALVLDGEVIAMLDWELCHLGDPLEDIGWVTNPLREREHTIPALWEHERLVAHWQAVSGLEANPRSIRWWSIFANFKLATISLTGVRSFVEGRADRAMFAPARIFSMLFDQIEAAERGA